MNKKNFKDLDNYNKLLETSKTFASSQGSYGRMYQGLLELNEEEVKELNSMPDFKICKDILDVIMVLEG